MGRFKTSQNKDEGIMLKNEKIKQLYNKYQKEFSDFEVVLGEGNINAKIFLIGEAPGKDEVLQGKPFVGMAGKNLSNFLDTINMKREDIYITNTIKYRLSKVNPKTGRIVNRPTTKKDLEQNVDYLYQEIDIINPTYIVTLGNVPLLAVTNDNNIRIGNVHGRLNDVKIRAKCYKLYPLYHPASVIYNRSLKEVYLEDMQHFSDILEKP